MICSFLSAKATCLYKPCLTFLHHLTQLIILSLYTVPILTLDLLILSFNCIHLIRLIVNTTSLYLIIALLLLLYTQVFLRVQFLALFFSPCIIDSHSITHRSFSDDLQLLMSALPYQIPNGFPLCRHVSVISKINQQPTCLYLTTARQNSCLSPIKELTISISYLLHSMLEFLSNAAEI